MCGWYVDFPSEIGAQTINTFKLWFCSTSCAECWFGGIECFWDSKYLIMEGCREEHSMKVIRTMATLVAGTISSGPPRIGFSLNHCGSAVADFITLPVAQTNFI
jgi:hypothetical protein